MAHGNVAEIVRLLGAMKKVDLTPMLENDMPRFPTHPPLVINPTIHHAHDGYYCQSIFMAEHTGAHVDAPFHIHADKQGQTIEKAPVDSLIGRAVRIDLSDMNLGPGEFASAKDFMDRETKQGAAIQKGDIVVVNFGWLKKTWSIPNWKQYACNCPGLDESVAHYLMDKGIKALGADTIAVGTAIKDSVLAFCHIHALVLRSGVYLMECLVNLELLPPEFLFVALPLKIKDGSGSPIRALAYI